MTTMIDVLQQMRDVLQPKGTLPCVRLFLKSSAFFEQAFVTDCINELEHAATIAGALGEPLSPLQKLALHVLKDSAFIDVPRTVKGNDHDQRS